MTRATIDHQEKNNLSHIYCCLPGIGSKKHKRNIHEKKGNKARDDCIKWNDIEPFTKLTKCSCGYPIYPCSNPKNTTVHPAPCHKPNMVKVTNVGRCRPTERKNLCKDFFSENFRITAMESGVNRYSVTNLVSVMCHRLQNSPIFLALNGDKKFRGK